MPIVLLATWYAHLILLDLMILIKLCTFIMRSAGFAASHVHSICPRYVHNWFDRLQSRYGFFQVKFMYVRGRYCSLTMNFVKLVNSKLNIDEISNLVSSPSCGAICLFVGTTRDNFENKQVSILLLFIVIRDFYHTVPFVVDTGKVNKSWNKHMPVVIAQSLQRGKNPILVHSCWKCHQT